MKLSLEMTKTSNTFTIQIAGMSMVCVQCETKITDTDASYLCKNQDGIVMPCMNHIPEWEYQTDITLTLRGEDALKIRYALQSLISGE